MLGYVRKMLMGGQSYLEMEQAILEFGSGSADIYQMVIQVKWKVLEIDQIMLEWQTEAEKSSTPAKAEAEGIRRSKAQDSSFQNAAGASAKMDPVGEKQSVMASSSSTS
jgi:hypothetical protein